MTVPHSIDYVMMECVHSVANLYRCSPFEVLRSDTEDFILTVNYLIERGAEQSQKKNKKVAHDPFWDLL